MDCLNCLKFPTYVCLCERVYLCDEHLCKHQGQHGYHPVERLNLAISTHQKDTLNRKLEISISKLENLKKEINTKTKELIKSIKTCNASLIIKIDSYLNNYTQLTTRSTFSQSQISEIENICCTNINVKHFQIDSVTETISEIFNQRLFDVSLDKKVQYCKFIETHNAEFKCIVVSKDGRILVTGSKDTSVRVWDVDTKTQAACLIQHSSDVNCVAISHDSSLVVSGSDDQSLILWDIQNKSSRNVYLGHSGFVFTVVFCRDSKTIVSGSSGHEIMFWNTDSTQCLRKINVGSEVYSSGISADFYYAGLKSSLEVYELISYQKLLTIMAHYGNINSIAITNDEKIIITGSDDKTVKIWNNSSKALISTLVGHSQQVTSVSVTTDDKYIISGSSDSSIILWSLELKSKLHTLTHHKMTVTGVSSFQDLIFSASFDSKIGIFRISSKNFDSFISLTYFTKGSENICGNLVSFGNDQKVMIYEINDGLNRTLPGLHQESVKTTCMSSNLKLLISSSCGREKKMILWNLEDIRTWTDLDGHTSSVTCVDISRNQQKAISGDEEGTIFLWDLLYFRHHHLPQGHSARVNSVQFMRNSDFAVSGGEDKKIVVWDLISKSIRKTFLDSNSCEKILITNDDKFIISASRVFGADVWNFQIGKKEARFEGLEESKKWMEENEYSDIELSNYLF